MSLLSCPCKSTLPYKSCCKSFHDGVIPDTAVELMRSRYSAYALCLSDYIIKTTDPESELAKKNKQSWKKQILQFCKQTKFEGLDILEHYQISEINAVVTFRASLKQGSKDAGFTEKSTFAKKNGRWFYAGGTQQVV